MNKDKFIEAIVEVLTSLTLVDVKRVLIYAKSLQ